MNRDQFERLGTFCIVAIMVLMVVGFVGSVMSMGFESAVSWYWTALSNIILGGGS
jgi:hypothetical protein